MSVVGSAYVIVRAISPGLRKDINKISQDAARAAAPALDSIGDRVEKATKTAAVRAGRAAAPDARDAGTRIGASISDGISNSFGMRAVGAVQRGLRRAIARAGPDKEGNNMGARLMAGFARGIDNFKVPMMPVLAAMLIPAIGGAIQIIGAYLGGAFALIGAIGPAFAAAGGVGIASMFALGGAVGSVMLALKTASPMLDRFKTAASVIGEEFKAIGLAVQEVLLPPLTQALGNLTAMIPTLTTGMSTVGAAVGGVAIRLSEMLTSSAVLRDLSDIFAAAGPQTTAFGGALSNILEVVIALAAAAGPLTTRFAEWLNVWSAGVLESVRLGQETGRLTAFFERAGDVAAQLGQIFGDTGRGLMNMFTASSESGQTLLDRISALASRFEEWSGSIQGQASLKAFFDNALPVLQEVNGLIGDIFQAMAKPLVEGNTDGVITFVQALRNDVLPAIVDMSGALAGLGPGLTELVVSISQFVSAMANSGALGAFTATLALLLGVVADLLAMPIVGDVLGWALAFAGMAKAVSLVMMPFGGLATALRILQPIFTALVKVILWVGRGLLGLLGPVGIVIAIIAGLVAAFVWAYNNSETFRNFIDKLVDTIQGALRSAVDWLKGAWDSVVDAFGRAGDAVSGVGTWFSQLGDTIQGAFRSAVDWLQGAWDGVVATFDRVVAALQSVWDFIAPFVDAITQPFQGIVQFFTGIWQVITGIFTGNMDSITTGVANMVAGVVRFFLGLPYRVLAGIVALGTMLWEWASGLWASVQPAISAGIDAVVAWFQALPGRVIAAVTVFAINLVTWANDALNQANAAVSAGIAATIEWFRALPGRVIAAVTTFAINLVTWANNALNRANAAVSAGIAATITWFRGLPNRVIAAVITLGSQLFSWAAGALERANSAVSSGIANVVTWFRGLPGRITGAIGNLGNLLYSAGRDVVEGLKRGFTGALEGALRTARELAGKIKNAVAGVFKLGSPSKVMIEIGGFVGEGLQIGIERMIRPVARAGAALAQAAITDPGSPTSIGRRVSAGASGTIAGGGGVQNVIHVTIDAQGLQSIRTLENFLEMLDTRTGMTTGTVSR